jgi:hypothetical protein
VIAKAMLTRVYRDRKIRSRSQRADIRKYSFINRIIQLWNKLPAGVGALPCEPSNLRKMFRKMHTASEVKVFRKTSKMKCNEVR